MGARHTAPRHTLPAAPGILPPHRIRPRRARHFAAAPHSPAPRPVFCCRTAFARAARRNWKKFILQFFKMCARI